MSNIVQALRKGYLGAGRCDTDGRREADLDDVAWDRSRSTMTRTPGTATKRMWDPPPSAKPQPAFTPPAGAQTLLNECEKAQDAVGLKDALKVLAGAWSDVQGPWMPQLAEAVMDKCPRDRLEAAAKLLEDGLASTIAKRALVVEKVPYRDPPDAADFWHTEDGAIIGESYHDARGDKMARESATREESARRLAKRLAGDRLLNKPPKEFHGRTLSDKAPLKRFPHTDIWTKNRAVPWHSDDLRGRDVFKGYVSTHTFSTGRCCWDPNKMPIVTPGPTTSDDFVQPHGTFMGEDVKGLPFSRMTGRGPGMPGPTRCISKPGVMFKKPKKQPSTYTHSLFGKTMSFTDFEPSFCDSTHTDHEIKIARAFAPVVKVQPPTPGKALITMKQTDAKYLAKVPNQVDFPFRPAKAGQQRFLTDERVTIFALPDEKCGAQAKEPGLGLHRPIKDIVSPGPVYDLRVHYPGRGPARMEAQKYTRQRASEIREARSTSLERASLASVSEVMEDSTANAIARVKARKDVKAKAVGASATFATAIRGENATYDSICGGTFMPPSFTPSPLNVTAPNPADLNANPRHAGPYQVKPCAVSMADTYVPWAYAHGRKPGASVFAMTGREGKY